MTWLITATPIYNLAGLRQIALDTYFGPTPNTDTFSPKDKWLYWAINSQETFEKLDRFLRVYSIKMYYSIMFKYRQQYEELMDLQGL